MIAEMAELRSPARPSPASPAGAEHLLAGLLAVSAGLGADLAVLVHLGVAVALIAAALARLGADLQHRLGQIGVVARVPRQHPARHVADVGAVEVGADALAQLIDHVLAQAGIGTR